MAAPYSLAQLLSPMNLDAVRSKYLASLQGAGFPALTEWVPKAGVEMAHVGMVSGSVADLVAADLPMLVAGGFLGLGSNPAYGASKLLTVLAKDLYLLERNGATYTTFRMKLTSTATASPYDFEVGDVWVVAPSGNRYQSITAGHLDPGGELVLSFQAEAAGARYADDPSRYVMALVTAFAGVSVQAETADFTDVILVGSSTGQIVPALTTVGVSPDPHTFRIQILDTGEVDSATWALAVDGGNFVPQGILRVSQDLIGGTSISAINGGETPSFQPGDIFQFTTPAGAGFIQGSDEETDMALASRCRSRWPALSRNPTAAVFRLWALLAYSSATRISVQPDNVLAGRVNMIAADSHGPLDVAALGTIYAFIKPRLQSVLDDFQAIPATTRSVTTQGIAYVKRSEMVAVQQAAQEGWILALGAVDLGPSEVELSTLVEVLIDAGATDVDTASLRFNNAFTNLKLLTGEIPVDGNPAGLAGALTWSIHA